MSGLARGWRIACRTIGVLRCDPSLAAFPALGAVAGAAALVLVSAPGVVWAVATDAWWPLAPFAVLAAYGATYLALYFNVALAVAATESLEGRKAQLGQGLAGARRRRRVIARWALLQATVGLLLHALHALASQNAAGRVAIPLVARLAGASWAIATFFAIPVLAFDGLGPKATLRRSADLIRERWGEGVAGAGAITLAVLLVGLVPAAVCVALAAAIGGTAAPAALIVLAAALVLGSAVTGTALSVIFRVALYRFAQDGGPVGQFEAVELAGAVRPARTTRVAV